MEKSKEMLKMERHYERVNGNAPGRNFLLVVGIIYVIGACMAAIMLIGPFYETLQLGVQFIVAFALILTVVAVTLQLITGIACIMWRNSISKSNILFIMALVMLALPFALTFAAYSVGGNPTFNLIGLIWPTLLFVGASKNRKIWKEQEEKRIFAEIRETM